MTKSSEHLEEKILFLMPSASSTIYKSHTHQAEVLPKHSLQVTDGHGITIHITAASTAKSSTCVNVNDEEDTDTKKLTSQPVRISHSCAEMTSYEASEKALANNTDSAAAHLSTSSNNNNYNNNYQANTKKSLTSSENHQTSENGGLDEHSVGMGEPQTHVYAKRWTILLIFCMITLLNSFNWIEYSIVQDVIIDFYNESLPSTPAERFDAVNWFSMTYMLCYIPLVFPAMFLLDRKGLKLSCMLGALLTTVGSIIKCFAVRSDLFAIAMIGQTVCAVAQVFTLGIPARLSALWFGPSEIARATSVGLFGKNDLKY